MTPLHGHQCDLGTKSNTRPFVGTTLAAAMSTWVQQDAMIGAIYVDTVTASMSLMSFGPTPVVVGHPRATLEDVMESED